MKNSHSPLPWSLSQSVQNQLVVLADNGTSNVCMVFGSLLSQDPENPINAVQTANAELIVRAVNSHQALVDALQNLCAAVSESGAHQQSTHIHTRLGQAQAVLKQLNLENDQG